MLTIILILLAVMLLPVILFFSLLGLALFVWSWRRIGPYFVSFGRWLASWRNLIPLGCLGTVIMIGVVLFTMILPPDLSLIRILLFVLVGLVGFIIAIFAFIVWTVRLVAWFWAWFRRTFWLYLERLWGLLWKGMSAEGRAGGRRPARMQQPPAKAGAGRSTDFGGTAADARPAARGVPAGRRSWLDLSWLWALVWGKPQKKRADSSKLMDKRPEAEAQAAAVAERAGPARVPTKPRIGLRPLMWRLGLVGRARQAGGKPKPAALKDTTEASRKPVTPAVPPAASEPRAAVAGSAAKPAESRPKPTIVVGAKPRRSPLGPVGRLGRSIGGALEGLRKGFWAGVFWVGRKARGGVDSILRVLRLGGKRR